jgi:enoyl-CoA hydratase/carnithine racemase
VTSPDPIVHVITMQKPPENRLTVAFAQTLISALRYIEATIGPGKPGCVIIEGSDAKFWCTGVELEESSQNPFASNDGFYPLLAVLLDYPFPIIALITGHTFGGAWPFSLACDYRIMNSERGFWCMPPVDLGLHFDGIGALVRLKLRPQVARQVLLEARRFTGAEALQAGIVDEIARPDEMRAIAIRAGRQHAHRATMGVYSLLRNELWGDALEKFTRVSYAHGKRPAALRVKI